MTSHIEAIENWLADAFQCTDIYRGKPKKIRKDAEWLNTQIVGPLEAERVRLLGVLDEIRDAVGASPDETAMQAIRRIADEHKKWADAIAEVSVTLRTDGYTEPQMVDAVHHLRADLGKWIDQQGVLLWLHAEAVWQRDQARERADKRLVKYVAVADELDALRASAVVLPGDWKKSVTTALRAWGQAPTVRILGLIESWLPATTKAAPPLTGIALADELWPPAQPEQFDAFTGGPKSGTVERIQADRQDWCGCQSNDVGGQSWHPRGDPTCTHFVSKGGKETSDAEQ